MHGRPPIVCRGAHASLQDSVRNFSSWPTSVSWCANQIFNTSPTCSWKNFPDIRQTSANGLPILAGSSYKGHFSTRGGQDIVPTSIAAIAVHCHQRFNQAAYRAPLHLRSPPACALSFPINLLIEAAHVHGVPAGCKRIPPRVTSCRMSDEVSSAYMERGMHRSESYSGFADSHVTFDL